MECAFASLSGEMTNQSATREKNLRSGKSLWEIDDKRRPANIRLEQSVRVDVEIVEAGVSGAFMAHMPNCYAVMGFGGNGIIHGTIAAQIVPTLIKGRADKDAAIFRFR